MTTYIWLAYCLYAQVPTQAFVKLLHCITLERIGVKLAASAGAFYFRGTISNVNKRIVATCALAWFALLACIAGIPLLTSRTAWSIYTSEFGYQISYPATWKYLSCQDGRQVFFTAPNDPVLHCEEPKDFEALSIIGPVSPDEQADSVKVPPSSEAFAINGVMAARYEDYLLGESTNERIELVVLQAHGEFFDFYISHGPTTNDAEAAVLGLKFR